MLRLLLVTLTLLIAATATSASPAATSTRRCAVGTTTISDNGVVRVYKSPTRYSARRFEVDACSYGNGNWTPLDLPASDIYAFLGPALALRGSVVGYAEEECDPNGDFACASGVRAADVSADDDLNAGFAGPKHHRLVKVGSLRVKGSGSLAWIACPERARYRAWGHRRPNCVAAGDHDYVMILSTVDHKEKVIDRGRRIDPGSLRLAGSHLSWVHGPRRRHATLP